MEILTIMVEINFIYFEQIIERSACGTQLRTARPASPQSQIRCHYQWENDQQEMRARDGENPFE